MAFLGGLASGLLGIGSSIITANANKAAASNAENAAQALQKNAFDQQVAYIQQQEQAQRAAIAGVAGHGNPYFGASQVLPHPTFAPGGQFGPQAAGQGANLNPMAAGAFTTNTPAPQAGGQAPGGQFPAASSPLSPPPGTVRIPPMAQGVAQSYGTPQGMRRTA
ncbi:MAG: hypothetical protein WCD38_11830 [Candidatus Tumulicola sp.]